MVLELEIITKVVFIGPAVIAGATAGLFTGFGITVLKNQIFYNGDMSEAGPYDWHTAPMWYTLTLAGGLVSGYLVYMA